MKLPQIMAALSLVAQGVAAATPETQAVEFYNPALQHYFITANATEALGIDKGDAGSGWTRTGRSFGVWVNPMNAPVGAAPVCRFYSTGANSHFFTAGDDECAGLKALETAQRQQAIQLGRVFTGWTFEGIAFTAAVPAQIASGRSASACEAGTEDIHRAYNNGFASGQGANHRFVNDAALRALMEDRGWISEGVAFCGPTQSSGTSAPTAPATGSFPELAATWSGPSRWEFEARPSGTKTEVSATLNATIAETGILTGSGNGCALAGAITQVDGFRALYTGTLGASTCADARFNGSYPLRIERLRSGQLQLHFGKETAASEIGIEALLSATIPPVITPPPTAGATSWTGTVAWVASQKTNGIDSVLLAVNQPLTLTLEGSSLTGTGLGCALTGTVLTAAAGGRTGTITAAGCQAPAFNGQYAQIELKPENGTGLEVEMEKEVESGSARTKATIRGELFQVGGVTVVTPPPPPPPPVNPPPSGFVLAGTWTAGNVEWTVRVRQGNGPEQTVTTTQALSLTIASGNSVTGLGFGCLFTGSIQQPSASIQAFVASLQAAGCTNSAFNGPYTAVALHEENGALQVEVEREIEGGGVRTKVRIEGVLRK